MTLITASQVTFYTITLGPLLALVLCLWVLASDKQRMTMDFAIVMVSNSFALVPILCLLINHLVSSYSRSFPAQPSTAGLSTSSVSAGNETVVFLALIYAAMMIGVSIYRNIKIIPRAAEDSEGVNP